MATVTRTRERVKQIDQADGTTIEEKFPVKAYVHCINDDCGLFHNPQEGLKNEREVPGLLEKRSYLYTDRGGDLPGEENSDEVVFCDNLEDTVCPECGLPVNVSGEPSPELPRQSFAPGDGLKGADRVAALTAAKMAEQRQAQDAVNEAEVADLRKQMAKLAKLVKDQPDEAA